MRHPFIKKAKKNNHLMDLIDRYRKWKLTRGDESDTDSGGESGGETGQDDSDTDWNMTVKGLPTQSYTDSLGYSDPVNCVSDIISNGDSSMGSISPVKDVSRDISPVKELHDRDMTSPVRDLRSPTEPRARSPSKEVRARSPEKQIIPTGLSPAKSESQIAGSVEKKRESRSLEHLNTAVENRAKEEERRRDEEKRRDEERRNNEENERRRKEEERRRNDEERRRVEEERRKIEERKQKDERRKSGVREARESREKSPSKQVKAPEIKEEKRRDSKGGKRISEEGRRSNVHHATINPLLSELARKHCAGRDSRHTDAVEELKNAFELAERSSPGITNRLVEQVLSKLQPGLSEGRLGAAMDNLSR
jgi:serine/threonine-protein kinase 24/25/MST4